MRITYTQVMLIIQSSRYQIILNIFCIKLYLKYLTTTKDTFAVVMKEENKASFLYFKMPDHFNIGMKAKH